VPYQQLNLPSLNEECCAQLLTQLEHLEPSIAKPKGEKPDVGT
jgi:hypothetical protein